MSVNFYIWETHWQTERKHKASVESWPTPFCEPADETTEFARAYAERWSGDAHFPDHPLRDADGKILLPENLDQSPADYLDAHEPPEPAPEPPPVLPYSGPMVIAASPVNSDIRAVYERSRRGLGRSIRIKPAPEPYQAPTPTAKGFTPSTPAAPPIAPRFYEADRNHPKYSKPGTRK